MKLDSKSRDILRFRPEVDFVEPDQEPSSPHPIELPPDAPTIDDIKEERLKMAKYARSVSTLAKIVQSLIDNEAAGVTIKLDPNVDAAAVQAMRRTYGVSGEITYDHFKQCEENLRKHGEAVAKKGRLSQDEIEDAREAILRNKDVPIGGIGTSEAANGGLRPELDNRNQIVDPIDLNAFQQDLIDLLVNTIWKKAFLPLFKPLPIIGSSMPEELVPVPENTKKQVEDINKETTEASEAGG